MSPRDAYRRLNEALAVLITRGVGSMTCAYLFAVLALLGLPAALRAGGVGFVAWFCQELLQLVLLSILAVGQQVQTRQAAEHREDIQSVHDRLDAHAEHLTEIRTHLTKPRTGRQRKESAP